MFLFASCGFNKYANGNEYLLKPCLQAKGFYYWLVTSEFSQQLLQNMQIEFHLSQSYVRTTNISSKWAKRFCKCSIF